MPTPTGLPGAKRLLLNQASPPSGFVDGKNVTASVTGGGQDFVRRIAECGERPSANHEVNRFGLPGVIVVQDELRLLGQERLAVFAVAVFCSASGADHLFGRDTIDLLGIDSPVYDEAKKNGWTVISMKKDWKRVFPFEK